MANNVNNVTAGKPKIGGAIFVAPVGTTLPTDAVSPLDETFEELGYISEDGLTQGITRDSDAIKAWGGDTVMTTQTDYAETFSFTMIEVMREAVRKVAFGDTNVTGALADGMTTKVNSKELEAHAFVFELLYNGAISRIVVPNGKVSEMGDITYVDGEPVGYNPTITALPDEAGNTSYEYTKTA